MDRRTLLKLVAAMTLAGSGQLKAETKGLHVVVAGAGIVGASIAYHLSKSGVSVTVIDKQGPATHASRGTFAWINATWAKQPRNYHSLNQDSLGNWKDLQQDLGIPIRWGGSLEWFNSAERQKLLMAQIAEQAQWGEPARMVSAAEFAALEPNINFGPNTGAAFSPNDGAVDPVAATFALLNAAKKLGAKVVYPSELIEVSMSGGRLTSVETSTGSIAADRLVLATGAEPGLLKSIGSMHIPQRTTPGVIAISKPMPRLLNRVIVAPGVHMHQREGGQIVLGEQEGAPQNEAHRMRLEGRPNAFPDEGVAKQHGDRILATATKFVPAMAAAEIADVHIGWRPLPIDGHPVLGPSVARPDIYLAIMHSGVSLAPIVGQLVTHELTAGVAVERLEQFRPSRAFESVKRY